MKNNKILLYIAPILCSVLAILSYLQVKNTYNNDSKKFKEEYESLNGKSSYSNKKYNKMTISRSNPMKYSNYDEILDVIENGTGIIYLGFPECPWCRSAVPVLLDVAKDKNIDTIYYLNVKNERDSYVVDGDKLTYALDDSGNEIKGSEGYFKLLDALDSHLSDYTISYEDKIYEVGEKRIFAPSVIFVKNGKIIGIQVSTVETQKDPYVNLTKKEYDELYSIYESYSNSIYSDTCNVGSSC